jgi:pyruvate ferredoxin oxidoreductase beta subunit
VDCGLIFLAEYENGKFTLNKNPKEFKSVKEYLTKQGRFKHLTDADIEKVIQHRDKKMGTNAKNGQIRITKKRVR